jgi:arsenite methyltransferase
METKSKQKKEKTIMKEDIRKKVQERYGRIAAESGSCCGAAKARSGCCGTAPSAGDLSASVGYSKDELGAIPEGANLGLGCGNPVALASLREGETVLDLGSGGGIDCFLASNKVGPKGRVIGVDMTPEMLRLSRENAEANGYANVEFRLGEIENLPLADHTVDAAISNCVINLSPDKDRVFREIFRVLKPGGRMMVSDIVLTGDLSERVKASVAAYTGCIGGALKREEYLAAIRKAGFSEVEIVAENGVPVDLWESTPVSAEEPAITREEIREALNAIASVKVSALKKK